MEHVTTMVEEAQKSIPDMELLEEMMHRTRAYRRTCITFSLYKRHHQRISMSENSETGVFLFFLQLCQPGSYAFKGNLLLLASPVLPTLGVYLLLIYSTCVHPRCR